MTDKEIDFYIDLISLKQIFMDTQCPPLGNKRGWFFPLPYSKIAFHKKA